jgi:hypothetical protein
VILAVQEPALDQRRQHQDPGRADNADDDCEAQLVRDEPPPLCYRRCSPQARQQAKAHAHLQEPKQRAGDGG